MALKSWAEASASPQYQNASPEQKEKMKQQYQSAGGVIPQDQTMPAPTQAPQEQNPNMLQQAAGALGQGASNFIQSAGTSISHNAANAIGGLTEMVEDKLGAQTDYGKRISQNANEVYQKRMSGIEEGLGKTAGQYAGIGADIALTVANPALAAGIIAGRETGRAYADQDASNTGGEKSATNALLVGGANYAAQRLLPGQGSQAAKSLLGRVAQGAAKSAVVGAKGGAAVGAAEALNKHGDNTDLGDVIEGTIEGTITGAAYGGAIGGAHAAFRGKGVPQRLQDAPENIKSQIGSEQESIMGAKNVDELNSAVSGAKHSNTAGALDLLDKNGFRINDSVALDHPEAQSILRTTQANAEKAATTQAEKSNLPGLPFTGPKRTQGKELADMEHNQKQADSLINASRDYQKSNLDRLNDVLDSNDKAMNEAVSSGDFVGKANDLKVATEADRALLNAYKSYSDDAVSFKDRTGEDLDAFFNRAKDLQAAYENPNVSPEMRSAIEGLKKVKGMQEGFTPIQDAHVLNETARLMSNQDRGWKTLTADAFKETPAPDLYKLQKLPGYIWNRTLGGVARSERAKQQVNNQEAIRNLASSDLAVSRSQRAAAQARESMENPPQNTIPFETSEPTRPDLIPQENVPAAEHPVQTEARRTPTPDGLETPMQRYQREQEARAEAARQDSEADVNPEARSLTAAELARAPRAPERPVEEVVPQPEPIPEPVPEVTQPRQMTAQELADAQRRVRELRRSEPEPEPTPEPTPEPAPTRLPPTNPERTTAGDIENSFKTISAGISDSGLARVAEKGSLHLTRPEAVQALKDAGDKYSYTLHEDGTATMYGGRDSKGEWVGGHAPEPVATPEPAPDTSTTARELVALRRQAKEANARREQERADQEAANAPETAPEPTTDKSEPLPASSPKPAEKAPEPVKPVEGVEKLAAMSTANRRAAETRAERFRRTLSSAAAKAKATAENFLSFRGDYRELQRSIRAEDQANNTERLAEMARNQLISQQSIADAKSTIVRDQFANWVKERGLPEKFARDALKAEQKGDNGNVSSLDALKRRAERLYQKQVDEDFNKMYQEALSEDSIRNPGEAAPTLKAQKDDFISEIDRLLGDEIMSPQQKTAIKERMSDYINDKFKAGEKAGREDGFESGKMGDMWEGLFNEYKRTAGTFLKANKEGQYKMAADAIAEREQRLTDALTKRRATLEAREKVKADAQTTKAMDAQRSEMEKLLSSLPEEIRDSNTSLTMRQMASHHDKGSPVPPERYRYMIERIGNNEHAYLERQSNTTQKQREEAEDKFNRMYEQAQELNRKYDVEKRSKAEVEQEKALQKTNDSLAVNRQRGDLSDRLTGYLKEKGITGEDADALVGSYMDNRYSLLEKPMTPVEHQNARARLESDAERMAKKFSDATTTEKSVMKATGDTEVDAKAHGEEVVKAANAAKEADSSVEGFRKEMEELEKAKSGLSKDERAEVDADVKAALDKANTEFIDKVEKAFREGKNLDELAQQAELIDKVYGADNVGNNRRFVSALKSAADAKKTFPNNPEVWFSKGDYQEIARLGAGSAGGNKGRALEKIYGMNDSRVKDKLLGSSEVEKMRNILTQNEGIKTPKFNTQNYGDFKTFLDKFDSAGNPIVKKGSLSDRLERERKKSQTRLRVRPKSE